MLAFWFGYVQVYTTTMYGILTKTADSAAWRTRSTGVLVDVAPVAYEVRTPPCCIVALELPILPLVTSFTLFSFLEKRTAAVELTLGD